jgi:enamine deaminase RidA (YjgF/YER057c/UK114 family)
MTTLYENPFPGDPDRSELWDMLVRRDIEAFARADWTAVAQDFDEDRFFAIDAHADADPDTWRITHPQVSDYRDDWLRQSREFNADVEDVAASLLAATTLADIEIAGDRAVAHKKFAGHARRKDGTLIPLCWQSLYQCARRDGRWRITGFVGYLPNPMGHPHRPGGRPAKHLPSAATQHSTAGPYSPVIEITPGRLVITSGQAALDDEGDVVGDTIEAQTAVTLANCARQLASAGCSLDDVFKVNVYLKDLDDWPRFNVVYGQHVTQPRPVRTAVGTDLLAGLLVEIEMWAVKA